MRSSNRKLLAATLSAVALIALAGVFAEANEPATFKVVAQEGGVWIMEGAAKVLRYQRESKALNGKFARANYVHPLFDLDGNELTEDFPSDHRHHRGIFWAWHQLSIGGRPIGDSWSIKNAVWDVRDVKVEEAADEAAIFATVEWKSPLWTNAEGGQKPFVREETAIRVHRAAADRRAVDFEIRLLALEPDVKIGGSDDEKGYGGFSPRLRLPTDVRFLGQNGELEPQITAIDVGPWVDLSGTYGAGDATSGVSILCHPTLPNFPPPWILRRAESMQNPVFPGAKPVLLSSETPLVLRYRLMIHRGQATIEQVGRWQREFAGAHSARGSHGDDGKN